MCARAGTAGRGPVAGGPPGAGGVGGPPRRRDSGAAARLGLRRRPPHGCGLYARRSARDDHHPHGRPPGLHDSGHRLPPHGLRAEWAAVRGMDARRLPHPRSARLPAGPLRCPLGCRQCALRCGPLCRTLARGVAVGASANHRASPSGRVHSLGHLRSGHRGPRAPHGDCGRVGDGAAEGLDTRLGHCRHGEPGRHDELLPAGRNHRHRHERARGRAALRSRRERRERRRIAGGYTGGLVQRGWAVGRDARQPRGPAPAAQRRHRRPRVQRAHPARLVDDLRVPRLYRHSAGRDVEPGAAGDAGARGARV